MTTPNAVEEGMRLAWEMADEQLSRHITRSVPKESGGADDKLQAYLQSQADRIAELEKALGACLQICEAERKEFQEQAALNNGRQSDMAFGSVNSAERIASAIRAATQGEQG